MKRLFLAFLLLPLVLSGCGGEKAAVDKKIQVVASIYPMAEFARAVGGDKVTVDTLVPAGTEAHDWQPAASDLKKIQASSLFIYNGAGMEPWAAKVLDSLGKDKVHALEAGKGLFIQAEEGGHESHSDHGESPDGRLDPHVWLDPVLAVKQVEAVRDALTKIDGKNSELYQSNAQKYIKELEKINREYEKLAARTKGKEFVTMHAAFGYLAKRYGWQQLALMGIDPHAEPTPASLAILSKTVKGKNIRYLFSEPQISDKTMQEVARQTGAQVLVLDPLETPTPGGGGYLAGMEKNRQQLAKALAGDDK